MQLKLLKISAKQIYYLPSGCGEFIQVWMDHNLQWDPEKYGGLRVIRLPYDSVWRPDILLYNK